MLHIDLGARSDAAIHVRSAIREWAVEHGYDPFPLMLVAVELVANARAAAGADGHVELSVQPEGDLVAICVVDDGLGFGTPDGHEPGMALPPPSAERGRGLFLVRQFSRDVRIERSHGTTVVRAAVEVGAPAVSGRDAAAGGHHDDQPVDQWPPPPSA